MKLVKGMQREYELAEKTKQKDIDGLRYRVAGQSSLCVKILKDRSQKKQAEISQIIQSGGFAGFERPLEIVTEKGKFAGYTFMGTPGPIIPEERPKQSPVNGGGGTSGSGNSGGTFGGTGGGNDLFGGGSSGGYVKQPTPAPSGSGQILFLLITGAVMFALTMLVLDDAILRYIFYKISTVAAQGAYMLSFKGILPAIVGVILMLLYHRSFGKNVSSTATYIVFAVLAFLIGLVIAYGVVGVLSVLITGIFGVVKAYQTVIITAVVLIVFGVMLLKK